MPRAFPTLDGSFDRVLMFDVVEHLYPWELHAAMREVHRVLRPDGRFIIHTAPNRWYDRYAYPWVRRFRSLLGQGARYPEDPRAITPVNQHVHVNEQDILSMRRALNAAGFRGKNLARFTAAGPARERRSRRAALAGVQRPAFPLVLRARAICRRREGNAASGRLSAAGGRCRPGSACACYLPPFSSPGSGFASTTFGDSAGSDTRRGQPWT
jgi:SAM-dependent methyltransferase